MSRAMEMKTPAEMKAETKIAQLKAQIEALNATRALHVAASPDRDLYENNSPKRKAKVIHKHTRVARMGTETMLEIVGILPNTLTDWLVGIAKPGERITMTVLR